MLIGLFRCVYRVIVSMCLGIFYIARMDRSLLFPGYEHRDIGYMTYLGSLEVELHHCHPVVVVFCDQMIKTVKNISTKSAQSLNSPDDPAYENRICGLSSVYTRKVRNRWQKMKTMISNQSLCKTSKTNISFEHLLTARKTLVGSTNQSSYL
ncbi:stimulated by retinoic acid gene 6 protein-like [Saccostrea cucullata]|uniref:stimulated by retinoic acid gene 6 protein-like n=1 Tax=Saccostrea cuccullata TaxID=36930 RepID=UPI002ED4467C